MEAAFPDVPAARGGVRIRSSQGSSVIAMISCILNFHGVGPVLRPMDKGESDCWIEAGFFEAVIDLVRSRPHVGITVDDGNASDFTHILPALLLRGVRAKFFICSGRLDQPSFVSRSHVREMLEKGMEIGSHGVAHRPWRNLCKSELKDELESSRLELGNVCGIPILEAACPFGSYDRKVLAELRRAGYRRIYTSDGGCAAEQEWIQPRITVTRLMSLGDVERLVTCNPGMFKRAGIRAKRICKRLR
jgi:peptidoglycan/xylan/chitin deacetylase (PgdA/CDA1 family)